MTKERSNVVLIVGELIIDYTLARPGKECKLRLGGVAHAARGLWASGLQYAVAAVCPKYLVNSAEHFLKCHGCSEFIWLGEVTGAPNVIVIGDPTEVSDQGYDELLRNQKDVNLRPIGDKLKPYSEVVVFPGKFPLPELRPLLCNNARIHFDIAYDISDMSELLSYSGNIYSIILSTSSQIFSDYGASNIQSLVEHLAPLDAQILLLKENRGGSRLFDLRDGSVEEIFATLGTTINSVGVGDVYSAVFAGFLTHGCIEAAWRGSRSATYYSQTTYPDDLKTDITRDLMLPVDTIRGLGGTFLPWHERRRYPIYLAAPDFSYIEKPELDSAIKSLEYHNFYLRRPVVENGQLEANSDFSTLKATYCKDLSLLEDCVAVFAVPLGKDPGTLIEMGMALQMGKPVITFDARRENRNTMVMAGSTVYSDNLDLCLNKLFEILSDFRRKSA